MNRPALTLTLTLALALALALAPAPAHAGTHEPSIAQTRAAALRYAGLEQHPRHSWARRARLSGLAPTLTLRASRGRQNDYDLSRASSGTERLAVGNDHDQLFEVRAVWRLDRLVFDPREIAAARANAQLARQRSDLLDHVTRLYFKRRRIELAARRIGPEDPEAAARASLDIAELTAQLDALTGGYFSEAGELR